MPRKKQFCSVLIFLCSLACGFESQAESLSGAGPGIFANEKHYQRGDVITVIISESSQAEQSASTQLSKDSKLGYTTGGLLANVVPSANLGANTSQTGQGDLARKGNMQARVGVEVQDLLENGNLKISGKQSIEFDSGTQLISVAGIVRPRDISSQNEVYSFKLANAEILYSGEGALHEKARTGFLTRILDILWIF